MSIMQLTQTIRLLPPLQRKKSTQHMQPMLPGMETEACKRPMVTNQQIADALFSVASLLEFQNSNPYRVQAYRHAARGILDLYESAATIIARGELLPMPGLGQRLQTRITELVQTGVMTFYNDLCVQSLPPSVRTLMALESVGLHTALRLYEELNIDTPEKLLWAAQQQRIRTLHGFGIRSEARLKAAAARFVKRAQPIRPLHGAA